MDRLRRESQRPGKEAAAFRLYTDREPPPAPGKLVDDRLMLIFACCHPALDSRTRVALTLRALCGLTTAEVGRAFLVSEATMAQPGRISGVLRVVYLVFTEGHRASTGSRVVRDELCDEAIRLARLLAGLCPGDPEVLGLLAMMLLTDARRAARTAADGRLVLLADQDRGRWDRAKIDEGSQLLDQALRLRRPGPYQIEAAIAACHTTVEHAGDTDWTEIAALYSLLAVHQPTPVVQANRAVAVAMAEGPGAGLALLDDLSGDSPGTGWHLVHACRADLLRRLGRVGEAAAAYRTALALGPPPAEREFISERLADLPAPPGPAVRHRETSAGG